MALFVFDRIGFLKSGDYKFRELVNGEIEAQAWLTVRDPNWQYFGDQETQEQLENLLGIESLSRERKESARPVLGPGDAALIIYRELAPGINAETTPPRVQDPWRYGLLSGPKSS